MLKGISPSMRRLCTALAVVGMLVSPAAASADPVLEWNALAVGVTAGNPFTQARFMAITQLAVFEAVNAVTGKYQPYLGTVVEAPGASAEAAAIAAAYRVLKTYFPTNALLDPARDELSGGDTGQCRQEPRHRNRRSGGRGNDREPRSTTTRLRPRRALRARAGRAGQMAAHAKLYCWRWSVLATGAL